jgi:hypothetical protein
MQLHTVPCAVIAIFACCGCSVSAVRSSVRGSAQGKGGGCGGAPSYENSEPADYKDAKKTFYNSETKKTEPVVFKSGDTIKFKCRPGFTTDGSKDGENTFDAECTDGGYYKPSGVCMKASKCGATPKIAHALPTGKSNKGKVEFACASGYSLDGEKVIEGGMGKNRFFELQCVEFSGEYEKFSGECKPFAFVPAGETLRIYNQVSEALFVVSCKGTLKTSFAGGKAPDGLDKVCEKFGDQSSACQGLVSTIKGDFETKLAAVKDHEDGSKKEWFEEDKEKPNIKDEATTFCTELWGLLALPSK